MVWDILRTGVWGHPELSVGSTKGRALENVSEVQVSAT